MPKRVLRGIVISDKMDKTIIVRVSKLKENKKYRKKYLVSKKYQAHDGKNEYQTGDKVEIIESRPISKKKCWLAKPKNKVKKNKIIKK